MLNFKQEHNVVKAGSTTSIGILAEFTAPKAERLMAELLQANYVPRGYVFCIDRSGSMSGDRIETVKQTLLNIIPRLPANDTVAIVTFGSDARVEVQPRKVSELSSYELKDRMQQMHAEGNTNMEAGLIEAMAIARSMNTEVKVVLLSDGQANQGQVDRVELAKLLANPSGSNWIMPAAIGIGRNYDEDLLNAIAEVAEGSQYAGINLDEAVGALESELEALVPPTYTDVQMCIQFDDAVVSRHTKVVPHSAVRSFPEDNVPVRAWFTDMSSEQIRNYLFEIRLRLRTGLPYGWHKIGSIILVAFNQETGELERFEQVLEVDNVAREYWREPDRHPDVYAEMRQIRLDRARAEVIELMNQGRVEAARDLIRRLEGDLREVLNLEGLTERARMQMTSSLFEVSSYLEMDPMELKKRMFEAKNRKDRNRDDFRGRGY